jgi:hypothetical protein
VQALSSIEPSRCEIVNMPFQGSTSPSQEHAMSKGQQRSNREPKKPKQTKQKIAVPAATSATARARPNPLVRGKKW